MSRAVANELQKIYDENGELTAPLVLSEAASPSSPLHRHFEWDDSVAGQKYRLEQARDLIRSVRIEVLDDSPSGPRRVRAYLNAVDESGRSYRRTEDVVANDRLRSDVMASWEREINALKARNKLFAAIYDEWITAEHAKITKAA